MDIHELQILGMAIFAGLSTLIGYFIVVLSKRAYSPTFVTLSMGFTAGVMIYLSFTELLGESVEMLNEIFPDKGALYTMLAFFGGLAFAALIDKMVPHYENPHEVDNDIPAATPRRASLYRVGILTTLAIAIHNFPEGIATVFGGVQDVELGMTIAIAIAIHNIPEGIAIAAPVLKATKSKKKAFQWTLIAGLAEPLGAFIGYYFLQGFITHTVFALLLAVIAGIMVFISFDQVLPATQRWGKHHLTTYSIILGMLVMALTILVA